MIGIVGTDLHIAAYALISGYVVYILNMFTTSVSTGTTPIISYNYGERLFGRLRSLMNSSVLVNLVSVGVLTVIFEVLAGPIITLFAGGDAELIAIATPAVRIVISCACLGSCISILSSYYEAITKLTLALFTGIARYLILATVIMLLLVFALGMGINGVWIALAVADVLAFVITVALMIHEAHSLKNREAQS